jgi:hypothetical protein
MPVTQFSYPSSLVSDEGFRQSRELALMTCAARGRLAADHFGEKVNDPRVITLEIPRYFMRSACTHYCGGAVRYMEGYDVSQDAVLGRLDLALESGCDSEKAQRHI